MAVEKLKMLSVVGPSAVFDSILKECIIGSEFHQENSFAAAKNVRGLVPYEQANPFSELMKKAYTVLSMVGAEPSWRDFSNSGLDRKTAEEYLDSVLGRLNAIEEEKRDCESRIAENRQFLIQLSHLGDINAQLQELTNFTYVRFRYGRIPRENYDAFSAQLENYEDLYYLPTGIEKEYVYGIYMMPRALEEKFDSIFMSIHFERIHIPSRARGIPSEQAKALAEEEEELKRRLERLDSDRLELVTLEKEPLLTCYSLVRRDFEAAEMRRHAAHTGESFFLVGWLPARRTTAMVKKLESREGVVCTVDDPENVEGVTPPVRLRNPVVFRGFETFVTTYGLPAYNELDPTCFMAVTYSLLFGIMFGDVGQGLVLILVGLLMKLIKKMSLGPIIMSAGVASTGFGFVYGSVFGNEELIPGYRLLESGDNINRMLIAAVALGAVLLTVSMVMNLINGVRQKDIGKLFFAPSGVAGFLFYWSVIAVALSAFMGDVFVLPPVLQTVLIIFIAMCVAVMFLREILGKLAARRKDWKPEKWGDYLLVSLFEMIEVLLSFATNTISFVRVGAFAINHAGLMMVVYMLAKTAAGTDNIAVLVIGNAFVMLLEGLVVGVQVLRLEFYEMFGKFFSGDGRPYKGSKIDYTSK